MKAFIVPDVTFKCDSRSSAMSSFVRAPATRDVGYTYFQTKLEDQHCNSLAML